MKKAVRLFIILSLLLLFVFNCEDREIHLVEDFPFAFNAWRQPEQDTVYLQQEVPITLAIRYEGKQTDDRFYLSTQRRLKSVLRHRAGGALTEDWSTDESGEIPLVFKPLEKGRHVLYFDVVDAYEQHERDSVVFYVKDAPFLLRLGEGEKRVCKGQAFESTLALKNFNDASGIQYQYQLFDSSEGKLYIGGALISKENPQLLKPGTYKLRYELDPTTQGSHTITLAVEDKRGHKSYYNYELYVEKNVIAVELTSDHKRISHLESTSLSLSAKPCYLLDKPYTLEITSDKGGRLFDVENRSVPLGKPLPSQDLKDKHYRFVPEKGGPSGTYTLIAKYTDSFGDAYVDTLKQQVALAEGPGGTTPTSSSATDHTEEPLDVVLTPMHSRTPQGVANPIALTVTPSRPKGGSYAIQYTLLQGQGRLQKDGVTLPLNTYSSLGAEDFEQQLRFTPLKGFTGAVALEVSVREKHSGASVYSDKADWQVVDSPLGLSLKPSKTWLYADEPLPVQVAVMKNLNTELDQYSIRYSIEGEATLQDAEGTAIAQGSFTALSSLNPAVRLLPKGSTGEIKLSVTVRESRYGQQQQASQSFEIFDKKALTVSLRPLEKSQSSFEVNGQYQFQLTPAYQGGAVPAALRDERIELSLSDASNGGLSDENDKAISSTSLLSLKNLSKKTFTYKPDRAGKQKLAWKLGEQSLGQKTLNMDPADFIWEKQLLPLELRPATEDYPLETYVNAPLHFSIDFKGASGLNGYTWGYTQRSGDGRLQLAGVPAKKSGNPLSGEQTLSFTYTKPTVTTAVAPEVLVFTASDGHGYSETVNLSIRVEANRIEVNLTPKHSLTPQGVANPLDLVVSPDRPKGGTYAIQYTLLQGRGSLEKDGKSLLLDRYTPLSAEDFKQPLRFTPAEGFTGAVELEVSVREQYSGALAYSNKTDWKVIDSPLGLSLKPSDSWLYARESTAIQVSVTKNLNADLSGYSIQYSTEGKATLQDAEGKAIPQDKFVPLDNLKSTIELRPTPPYGDSLPLQLTVKENKYGQIQRKTVSFTVFDSDQLSLKLSPIGGSEEHFRTNQTYQFTLTPQYRGKDLNAKQTEQLKYESIKITHDSKKGAIRYTSGEKVYTLAFSYMTNLPAPLGQLFTYIPLKAGEQLIEAKLLIYNPRARESKEKELLKQKLQVDDVPFVWEGEEKRAEIYVDEPFRFSLTFANAPGVNDYKWGYTKTSRTGVLTFNDKTLNPTRDVSKYLAISGSKKLGFTYRNPSPTAGEELLSFTAVDKYGQKKTVTLRIEVKPNTVGLTLRPNPDKNWLYADEQRPFQLVVTPNPGQSTDTYAIKYDVSGNASTLTQGTAVISQGQFKALGNNLSPRLNLALNKATAYNQKLTLQASLQVHGHTVATATKTLEVFDKEALTSNILAFGGSQPTFEENRNYSFELVAGYQGGAVPAELSQEPIELSLSDPSNGKLNDEDRAAMTLGSLSGKIFTYKPTRPGSQTLRVWVKGKEIGKKQLTIKPVLVPPRVKSADLYYKKKNRFAKNPIRSIRVQYVEGIKGTYPISKIRVLVDHCDNGAFSRYKTFSYADRRGPVELYRTGSSRTWGREVKCVQGRAKGTIWLMDSEGNWSKPFVVTMR